MIKCAMCVLSQRQQIYLCANIRTFFDRHVALSVQSLSVPVSVPVHVSAQCVSAYDMPIDEWAHLLSAHSLFAHLCCMQLCLPSA